MPDRGRLAVPSFITRVELHGATAEDYVRLHGAMTAANFHRTIVGDDGVQYQLPTAEYFSHGPDLTAPQVRHLADQAAQTTGRSSWVLVCQYAAGAWRLPPVNTTGALSRNALSPFFRPTR
jgi:hypothetical protein